MSTSGGIDGDLKPEVVADYVNVLAEFEQRFRVFSCREI